MRVPAAPLDRRDAGRNRGRGRSGRRPRPDDADVGAGSLADPLEGVRAKLDRAAEHLTVLDEETAAFFESKPYVVEAEFDADVTEYVFYITPTRQPPLRLGLLLGDCAHNLRSALDHLTCALAVLDTGGTATCERTQFPICSSEGNFKKHQGTWLAGLNATHVADLKRLQPYHAGKDAPHHFLTLLNWLDNVDKHRIVHPTFGYFNPTPQEARAIRFVAANKQAGTIRWKRVAKGRRIEGKADVARVKLAPLGTKPKVQMYGKLTFDPAFGTEWLRGSSIPEIYRRVKGLVEGFAGDFA